MKNELQVLPVLNDIQYDINLKIDLKSNLQSIIEKSKRLINFDYCGILTKNNEDDILSPLWLAPEALFNKSQIKNGFITWILNSGISLLSNNVVEEKKAKYKHMTVAEDEKSFLGTPLILNRNEIEGVFFILSKETNAFSNSDLTIIESLAGLVITSLNKSESLKRTILVMRKASKDLHTKVRDTKRIMNKIVQCGIELTNSADHGCLVLYYTDSNRLECRYADNCEIFDKAKKKGCIFSV